MVKSGRGKKDTELIKKYMTNKKIIDGQTVIYTIKEIFPQKFVYQVGISYTY
jgi:adenylate kinase family enzyme